MHRLIIINFNLKKIGFIVNEVWVGCSQLGPNYAYMPNFSYLAKKSIKAVKP